jgi:feruloyl esterase
MHVDTSNASGIVLEAWLPSNWSGRFLSTGNGGLAGCIQYYDLAYTAGLGFAAVGANNGHNGTSGKPFYNAPEVVEDFAYRSVHTGVVVGKEVTQMFYRKNYTKSYWLGCSTGGRQGMKSAQVFPEDFDGIVAGAPAFDFVDLTSWSLWLQVVTGFDNSSASFVPQNLWTAVHAEILRQCDGLDGAVDGYVVQIHLSFYLPPLAISRTLTCLDSIIEDPDLCHPNFEPLICNTTTRTPNTTPCLTGAQATRVRRVFDPLYGTSGELIYPRMQPGSELAAYSFFYSGVPFIYSSDWYKYVVYNNPAWDPTTFTLTDIETARAQDPYNISTFSGDLSAYRDKGGKLLTYHGLQDQLISSDNSERYYHKLAETMNASPTDLDEFYRYFRIGGMSHCRGGPGAWNIGAYATGGSFTTTSKDPRDNVLEAMVAWVEEGTAPEYVRGYKYVNDTISKGLAFTRKHCRFPKRNAFVGPGNYTDEAAWKCV